jgi:hypothetical protein
VVWPGAALMCEWLAQQQLEGANVLELGSGTGACGLFAAGLGAQTVLLTDGGSDTLLNLIRENAERNKPLLGSSSVRVERLVWGDVADSCAVMSTSEPCDYILAAAVLYGTGPLDATQRSEALAATFEAMLLCVPSDPPAAGPPRIIVTHDHRSRSLRGPLPWDMGDEVLAHFVGACARRGLSVRELLSKRPVLLHRSEVEEAAATTGGGDKMKDNVGLQDEAVCTWSADLVVLEVEAAA